MPRPGLTLYPEEFADHYVRAGYWRGVPLGSWPWDWASRYGDRTALVDDDRSLGFRDLAEHTDALAGRLLALGLRPGDNIVVQLPNRWEFVVLFLACQRINVVPVLALPADRDHEIGVLVERVRATALAVPATWRGYDHLALAGRVREQAGRDLHILVAGGDGGRPGADLRAMARPGPEPAVQRALLDALPVDPRDAALILLTGGTTATPKLIARTHEDYHYAVRTSAEVCGVDDRSVYLAALPISHGFALGAPGVLGTLSCGGRVVLSPSPNPETVFALIERHRVTRTSATPAVAQRWMEEAGRTPHDISSLDVLLIGGAALPPEVAEQITPTLGCRLQQVLGMSEGLICYTRLDDPPEVVHRTQGRPMSPGDELMVVGPDGAPVPDGEEGELLTRGPYTIRGYFADPAGNARSFTPDGWYRSGDLVRRDADGNVVVRGRIKDIINRGGEKISAEEVEVALLAHPDIEQLSVIPVPDPGLGERVCLCAVPRAGREIGLGDIQRICAEVGLARYKIPEQLVLLDSLPLTPIGKIDKKALAARVAQPSSPLSLRS
ncbi:(2,3-dihydroxybenzoyl)adenylate synthase [Actinomadura macrotermitis]|uniref:Salicylyl-CoA synthase / salicylate adenylyltransferase n=1 Tax=Actinomadura macrotermitis TaxID=2585200 RepID=A0A7K0BV23_9ACTN|nr:AMP-binding protein [Actinomadura macrotermitis]MQY05055.1 Salicylyl-CoA synthase / salicylate adenylyltransferase [Actinomadura macrotermitis]